MQGPSLAAREHNKKYEIFVYDLLKYYPTIHRKHTAMREKIISDTLRRVLNRGIEQGLFRGDLHVDYLVPLCNGWNDMAIDAFLKLPKSEHKTYLRFMLDAFMHLVCNAQGLDYYHKNYVQVEK
jgi:hypothetical protein